MRKHLVGSVVDPQASMVDRLGVDSRIVQRTDRRSDSQLDVATHHLDALALRLEIVLAGRRKGELGDLTGNPTRDPYHIRQVDHSDPASTLQYTALKFLATDPDWAEYTHTGDNDPRTS